jgi:hypothetical protein
MGGGVSQSSTRTVAENGAAGLSTDAIIDKFIHEYLAEDLMKLQPLDGVVADPEHNWVLAGKTTDAVLLYSRARAAITLTTPLAHPTYRGIWFDPSTGQTRDAPGISGKAGTTIDKPDDKGWLLLLRLRSWSFLTPADRDRG